MFGQTLVFALFVLSILSALFYLIHALQKQDKKKTAILNIGRNMFLTVFFGTVLISGFLLSEILAHNYQYYYIWSYSSNELPFYLLVSSFFSGQEGSFLLWALFLVITGVFMMPQVRRLGIEDIAMGLFNLVLIFIFLMLILKSPFDMIWDRFPDVAPGFMPQNGRGLNPILQNFWITIHPPVLFAGYSLLVVPYILALTAFIKKDFEIWTLPTIKWNLVAAGTLGFGILLGAFWSYETLNWGGYWGWDPVENSSLLPWLVSVALVHTLIVQRKTGGLQKTNFVLAALGFILVLFATFLTRSGVLGDTSVHSFMDPGTVVYSALLIFIVFFLLIALIVFFMRIKSAPRPEKEMRTGSREFMISMGSLALLATAVIVFIGTTYPILMEILGKEKVSAQISYYNEWTHPITIIILLINGLSLYFSWRSSGSVAAAIKRLLPAMAISMALTALIFFLGADEVRYMPLIFGANFALIANIIILFPIALKAFGKTGSYLSHAALGLFMLGVVATGVYSASKVVVFQQDEQMKTLGAYTKFIGSRQIEKDKKDREKWLCEIEFSDGQQTDIVAPVVFWSDFNERKEPVFEPGIYRKLFRDYYVSPRSLENSYSGMTFHLARTVAQRIDDSLWVRMDHFDMSNMQQQTGDKFNFGTVVSFFSDSSEAAYMFTDTLHAMLDMNTGSMEPVFRKLPGRELYIGFSDFLSNNEAMAMSKAGFTVVDNPDNPEIKETFIAEISVKPMINLVWLGGLLICAGFFIALINYRKK